jgi:saccharopine dehydrogenase (NAD+, L-lysine forming)
LKKGILIIGAGGVSSVAVHKCAISINIFEKITLASRTIKKCQDIKKTIFDKYQVDINIEQIDANDINQLVVLINKINPKVVLNLALPYQDLDIMDACIKCKVDYIDTANYEHPNEAKFEYKLQWDRHEQFKNNSIQALLGSGFDPGVTGVFCAYAKKHYFDEIHYIDILDCNAGDHGYAFATNFNPEINLREVSANGRYWQEGKWITTKPLEIKIKWDYPEIGVKDSYLLYHEELESLSKNIKGVKRIRFFMTFSQSYITHMNCLQNIGMLGINKINHKGIDIIPIEFLSTLLPNPSSLASKTKGKTNIGCVIEGIKNGIKKKIYIYNVCNHEECFKEVGSQAISYTTGVPAFIGAKLVYQDIWNKKGVYNIEQFDPDVFMEELNIQGLPWKIKVLD